MKTTYTISVDLLSYINDSHDAIPEADREWIADKIQRHFDYSSLYEQLENWVSEICIANHLPYGEADEPLEP